MAPSLRCRPQALARPATMGLALLMGCGFRPEEGTYTITDVIGRLRCRETAVTVTTIEEEGGDLEVSGLDHERFDLHLGSCPGGMCTTLDVSCALGELGEQAFACDPIIDPEDQTWEVSGVWLSTTELQAQLIYDSCSDELLNRTCTCLGDWFFDAAL